MPVPASESSTSYWYSFVGGFDGGPMAPPAGVCTGGVAAADAKYVPFVVVAAPGVPAGMSWCRNAPDGVGGPAGVDGVGVWAILGETTCETGDADGIKRLLGELLPLLVVALFGCPLFGKGEGIGMGEAAADVGSAGVGRGRGGATLAGWAPVDGSARGDAREFGVDGVAGLRALFMEPFVIIGEKTPVGDCVMPVGEGAGESRCFLEGGCPEKPPGSGAGDGLNCDGEKVR